MSERELMKKVTDANMPDLEKVRKNCLVEPVGKENRRNMFFKVVTPLVIVCVALFTVPKIQGYFIERNRVDVVRPPIKTTEQGVVIPEVKPPKKSSNANLADACMISLLMHEGKKYTETSMLVTDESTKEMLLDERLGTALANIDLGSGQEDYNKELASTIPGEVYTVKGYNPSFRLGVVETFEGKFYIHFLENLTGITLKTGEDLYGSNRLGLKGNYQEVVYQTHKDWDNEKKNYKPIPIGINIDEFVNVLFGASFVDASKDSVDIYERNLKQVHLYFKKNDGTTVEIRLFENGYVGYQGMSDRVFVHMTDPLFQKLFNEIAD